MHLSEMIAQRLKKMGSGTIVLAPSNDRYSEI